MSNVDRISVRPGTPRRRRLALPAGVIPLPVAGQAPQRVTYRGPSARTPIAAASAEVVAPQPSVEVGPESAPESKSLRALVLMIASKLDDLSHLVSAIYNDVLDARARLDAIERYLAGDDHALDGLEQGMYDAEPVLEATAPDDPVDGDPHASDADPPEQTPPDAATESPAGETVQDVPSEGSNDPHEGSVSDPDVGETERIAETEPADAPTERIDSDADA